MINNYHKIFIFIALISFNVNASNERDDFERLLRDPTISKEEKKKAFIDNLIKEKPEMKAVLEMPQVRKQFEMQFEQVFALMTLANSMDIENKKETKKPKKEKSDKKPMTVEESIAIGRANHQKKYEKQQRKIAAKQLKEKEKMEKQISEVKFPKRLEPVTPFFKFGNSKAISGISFKIPFIPKSNLYSDYCKEFGTINGIKWSLIRSRQLRELKHTKIQIVDDKDNIIDINKYIAIGDGDRHLTLNKYESMFGSRGGKKDLKQGDGYYPICVADLDEVKVAMRPDNWNNKAGEYAKVDGIHKVDIGEIYLGMKLNVSDSGIVNDFIWHTNLYNSDEMKIIPVQPRSSAFGIGSSFEVFQKRCLLKADKKLLTDFSINDSRLVNLMNGNFGLKLFIFSLDGFHYSTALDSKNRIVLISATKRFKTKPTINQVIAAVESKYGVPVHSIGNKKYELEYYYDKSFSKIKSEQNRINSIRQRSKLRKEIANYPHYIGSSTFIEYMDREKGIVDAFNVKYNGSMNYYAQSGTLIMKALDSGIKQCQNNINGYLEKLKTDDKQQQIEI